MMSVYVYSFGTCFGQLWLMLIGDALVGILTGEGEASENLFTWTLYRNITDNSRLQQNVSTLIGEAPTIYAGVDTVKDWFESQLDTWMTVPAARQDKNSAMSTL